jgi:predicted secreted protein
MQPVRPGRWAHAVRWLLVAVIAVACQSHFAFAATTVVTDADKDGSVQVKLGDKLEVRLKSNPSTGYAWTVHPKSSVLLRLAAETQAQPAEPDPDRPVLQVFTFEAKRKGDGILLMRYARAKEKPFLGEEQFNVRVVIE